MRQVSLKSWLFAAALMLMPALAEPAVAQTGGIVSAIRVDGNQRIEPDTVRSYLLVAPGDRYQPEVVDQSLKRKGVDFHAWAPERLSAEAISQYLQAKKRQVLA